MASRFPLPTFSEPSGFKYPQFLNVEFVTTLLNDAVSKYNPTPLDPSIIQLLIVTWLEPSHTYIDVPLLFLKLIFSKVIWWGAVFWICG